MIPMPTPSLPTTAPLRIAAIGLGSIGQQHACRIAAHPSATLSAICDVNTTRLESTAHQFPVTTFADHRALLNADCCDAVLVATPHHTHAHICIDVITAGLHCLMEKPLALSVMEADRLLAHIEAADVVVGIMHQRRATSPYLHLVSLLKEGALGSIHYAALKGTYFRPQAHLNRAEWRCKWLQSGSGAMMTQACHDIDLLCSLLGPPSRVFGRVRSRLHSAEVEDEAIGMLTYPDGTWVNLFISTCDYPNESLLEIRGDRGSAKLSGERLDIFTLSDSLTSSVTSATSPWDNPSCSHDTLQNVDTRCVYSAVISNFCDAILRGAPLICPAQEGIWALEVANALILSSQIGREVTVPVDRVAYARTLRLLGHSRS